MDPNPDMAAIAANMAAMAQLIKTMQDAQAQAIPGGSNGHNSLASAFAKKNKEFGELGGRSFTGEGGPIVADQWLDSCEEIFTKMELDEVKKQELATHRLDGPARFWWQSALKSADKTNISWKEFKQMFEEEYIPFAARLKLIQEFQNLKQGSSSVPEYVAKFHELSRYAPYLVDEPLKKNQKFMEGLHPAIAHVMINSIELPFNKFVGFATQHEQSRKDMFARRDPKKNQWTAEDSGKTGGHQNQRRFGKNKKFGKKPYQKPQQQQMTKPQHQLILAPVPQITAPAALQQGKNVDKVCHNCGKTGHFQKNCNLPKNVQCFRCRQYGHFQKNCPLNQGQSYAIMPADQNVQARAFVQFPASEQQ